MFECSRSHVESVTPHSHRFDFVCEVLIGQVTNRLWKENHDVYAKDDVYMATEKVYTGEPGVYEDGGSYTGQFFMKDTDYRAGEIYNMKHDQIHSIYFSKGAKVLFLEGPTVTNKSTILQPFVDGEVVPTFRVEDWMYKLGK